MNNNLCFAESYRKGLGAGIAMKPQQTWTRFQKVFLWEPFLGVEGGFDEILGCRGVSLTPWELARCLTKSQLRPRVPLCTIATGLQSI